MVLKPQDLLVVLKMVALGRAASWTYNGLAFELGMSPSEVHSGVKRAVRADLARWNEGGAPARPVTRSLEEFVLHGVRHVFVPDRGGETRGLPTAWAAPVMRDQVLASSEMPPVWPHPEGMERGLEFSPLYRAAPGAALRDPRLYDLLALVDTLRAGRARERKLAGSLFKEMIREESNGRESEP